MHNPVQEILKKECSKADVWLRKRGVEGGLEVLYRDPSVSPRCIPELLELLEMPYSLHTRELIASAIIHRKPNAAQKHQAFEVFLAVLKERIGQYDVFLSTMVLSSLASFVTPERVCEVGEMTADPRYGEIRAELTYVLRKIGNVEAIAYLLRAAKDPVTAALALDGLAHLKVAEALPLCEDALNNPTIPKSHKPAIKSTYSKLKRRAAKKIAAPTHVTTEPISKGLAEWSANLDAGDLPKFLRCIANCVKGGFGRPEIVEVNGVADDLASEQTARLKFAVRFSGKETTLWMEIFCDDENSVDLYLFAEAKFIEGVERKTESLLK